MFKDFELVKDALGSPYFFVIVIALMALSPTLYKFFSRNKKCPYCKKGRMKEAETEVLKSMHYDNGGFGAGGGHSTSKLRVKVKYRCTHCDEFMEITENR